MLVIRGVRLILHGWSLTLWIWVTQSSTSAKECLGVYAGVWNEVLDGLIRIGTLRKCGCRVKNQFQEKLQGRIPLLDILKSTQLNFNEAQPMNLLGKWNNEAMAKELEQNKLPVTNNSMLIERLYNRKFNICRMRWKNLKIKRT